MNPVDLLLTGHPGDRRCGVDSRRAMTYGEMREAVTRYAGRLAAAGVRPGSRAVVVADDSLAAIAAVLGLWWHGCVPVLLHPMLRDAEIAFVVRDCSAELADLHVAPGRAAALRGELAGVRTELPAGSGGPAGPPADFGDTDELLVQYTSGSTGRPRGVRHCLAGVRAVLAGMGSLLALGPDDVVLSTAKLSFGYGFGNSLLLPYAAGAGSVLLDGPADGFGIAAALARHRPTVLLSVPRLYAGLLRLAEQGKPVDVSSLRLAVATGEHLPAELATRIRELVGVPLVNGFGATEVLHTVVAAVVGEGAPFGPGSIGVPVPGVTATVRDDAGRPVGADTPGRLHISAASVGLGYVDRPAETARTFADGGVYTGDIALRTAAGELRHVARADDMLLLGGYKIAPAEIEEVLRRVPGVADCAVVGSTDAAGLAQATAYVVVRDSVEPAAARRAVKAALRDLAPYKRPSRVEILDALPTTSTGKLARFRLRDGGGSA